MSLVPKTITDNGSTLTLGAVEWSGGGEGAYYTATATYTGTATSRYATGYTVTANYIGQVAKTDCSVVTYTAVFGSEKLLTVVAPSEAPSQPDETEPSETEAPGLEPAGAEVSMAFIPILGCVGGVVALGAAGLWTAQKLKERRHKS